MGYSKHGSYFNSYNTTHNQPYTSLYKFLDQKRTGIWKPFCYKTHKPFSAFISQYQKLASLVSSNKKLGYFNHGYYFNSYNTTHNQPSTSLYKLLDQKRTGIWKPSIQASNVGRENFKIFGLHHEQESMMIMVTRKKGFCNQIGPNRQKIFILYVTHYGIHH